jgi:hypothetical protein
MRTFLLVFLVVASMLSGCKSPSTDTKVPLNFHVVSPQKIEGERFIDTFDFPKLGYIASVPALELQQLEEVIPDTQQPSSTDTNPVGAQLPQTTPMSFSFQVRMRPSDAIRFAAVTEKAVGKQILLMLGDEPLMVVRVMTPIKGPYLQLQFDEKHDRAKIGNALKELTK